jgi:hypothetical protein
VRKRRAPEPEWQPDPKIVRLINWALAGQPESGPLPPGAAERLASRRRAELFEAWEAVHRFGPSAAEPLRHAYNLPEELTHAPEGIVTQVQAPPFADGIAEMLLEEPTVIGHDARGFAITDGKPHWAEMEWPTRETLREYLLRKAKNLLWLRMRREDRENTRVIAQQTFRQEGLRLAAYLNRRQLLHDVEKCFSPIRQKMPELARYFRVLAAAANPETAEVDLARVAERYHVPVDRIESFLDTTILRKWKLEFEALRLQLSPYVKRRRVRCVRPDPELPGQFRMEDD